jgi:HEAT repeat protein
LERRGIGAFSGSGAADHKFGRRLKRSRRGAENHMMQGFLSLLAAVSAAILFFGLIAGALWLGRTRSRGDRQRAREQIAALIRVWREQSGPAGSAHAIRRQARAADEVAFWGALETLSFELDARAMRRLSNAVADLRHHRRERRALRDESPWRRELAARRLGLIHSPSSRRSLRDALEQGPELVAYTAAQSLARQRDARTLRWILDHPSYFASRAPRARTALLRAFGPGATALLAERLESGIGDQALERSVIERLGAAGHQPSGAAILRRLDSPTTDLRVAAARALGRLRLAEAAPALIRALTDDSWEVRAQAARSLGSLGDATAIRPLGGLLEDPEWWVRHHAAQSLAALQPHVEPASRRSVRVP